MAFKDEVHSFKAKKTDFKKSIIFANTRMHKHKENGQKQEPAGWRSDTK